MTENKKLIISFDQNPCTDEPILTVSEHFPRGEIKILNHIYGKRAIRLYHELFGIPEKPITTIDELLEELRIRGYNVEVDSLDGMSIIRVQRGSLRFNYAVQKDFFVNPEGMYITALREIDSAFERAENQEVPKG